MAKEKYNLDVEVVTFNDFVLPNEALNNGDLDANAFQHKPYLDKQIQSAAISWFRLAPRSFIR